MKILHYQAPRGFQSPPPSNSQPHIQPSENDMAQSHSEHPRPMSAVAETTLPPLVKPALPLKREPRKAALLIGIKYQAHDGKQLVGPHKDVRDMKQLLIDRYDYEEKNITTLIDSDDPQQLQPTRRNMICKMMELTADAQPGDRFFFHYAGHSTQVDNKDNSEEDGKDECLVPADFSQSSGLIKDNDLRRILVDKLPGGCTLVAVFDSCHSASLLDLEHYRCNRVYTPWVSKGRRKSASLWNKNVRRCAEQPAHSFRISNAPQSNSGSPVDQINLNHRRTILSGRAGLASARWKESSIDRILSSVSASEDKHLISAVSTALSISTDVDRPKTAMFESPTRYCATPEPLWPCDGFCRDKEVDEPPEDGPPRLVVSLSAAQDDQKSWEDKDGASMTQALIGLLYEDRTPTFHKLLTRVSHDLHRSYIHLHDNARGYKKIYKDCVEKAIRCKRPVRARRTVEMDNFQDPQLSSLLPLNMNDRLPL